MESGKKFLMKWLVNISVAYFICVVYLFCAAIVFSLLEMNMDEISLWSPFLEESARYLSILIGGYVTYLFTLFFAVGEFKDHIMAYSANNGAISLQFIIFRFVCIIAHFLLLAIQLFGFKLSRKYNSKLYTYMGLLAAMMWHYVFNTGGGHLLYSFINYLLGLF